MIGRRVDLIIINKATSESYAYYIWLLGAKIRKTFKKEKKQGKKVLLHYYTAKALFIITLFTLTQISNLV